MATDGAREEHLRKEVVRVSGLLAQKGWVANHDGNITVRLPQENRWLATPTAISKADVTAETLITINEKAEVVQGTRKAFSELKLHFAAYNARSDVKCVLHAHPPFCCAFASANRELDHPFMAESVTSIGPSIPLVRFGLPGEEALNQDLTSKLQTAHCVILGNHGALVVGPDPDTCFLRMELMEHLASINQKSIALGGPQRLPSDVVQKLTEGHRKLFPIPPRDGVPAPVPTPVPAPPAPTPSKRAAPASSDEPARKRRKRRELPFTPTLFGSSA